MAVTYPTQWGSVASPTRPKQKATTSPLRVVEATFTMAAQTTSDTLAMRLPKGFRPEFLGLFPSATLGSSTISIGPTGTLGKYRAAAAITVTTLAPVLLGTDAVLTADEDLILTIAAATMPASGTLTVRFYGTET